MEKIFKKAAKNTFFLTSSQVISRIVGFAFFIFLARSLGVENFGVYVFTISLMYNFIPVADFGLERLVLRDVSRDHSRENEYLAKLIPLRFLLSLAAYVLCLVLGYLLKLNSAQIIYLAVFGLSLFPVNFVYLIISILNAKEKMQYMAGTGLATILLTAILGIIVISEKLNLFWLFFSYPVACFLVGIYFIFLTKRLRLKLGWKIDLSLWGKSLSESWVFAVFTILAVFYLRATLIMTKTFLGSEEAGIYGSVYKFVEAGILLPQSLALALFPLSSRLSTGSPKKLANLYLKGLGVLFLLSLPVAAILILFSRQIVLLAYGVSYLRAVEILPILGISLILFFVNSLPGNIIQNSDKVRNFLPLSILIFMFVYILGFLAIPNYGLAGAAWVVIGGEAFGFTVSNLFVYRLLKHA